MHRRDQIQTRSFQGLIGRKVRKRGCSSSSSCSSSLVNNGYRFKKAVMVSTPLIWKKSERDLVEKEEGVRGVSARKLAAALWGLNEDQRSVDVDVEEGRRGLGKERSGGLFPPHLSDPSHSPNSERMGRSRSGSVRGRTPTFGNRVKQNPAVESETRSIKESPRTLSMGVRDQLKEVRNVIMTSKELVKIIDHVWGREEQSSSSVAIVLALHQELERGRLLVDQLIQGQEFSGHTDVSRLIKQFAEERVVWKVKEREMVDAAIQTIAGELEGERRLRRRFENLNKKLGAELASLKETFQTVTEELESERRTRKILEQVCDELAGNIDEDKAHLEQLKIESEKALQEVEKDREMLRVADLLREERVQMKLSDAKHQFEEKNAAVVKLKRQLETLLKPHKTKGKTSKTSQSRLDHESSAEITRFLDNIRFNTDDYEMEENDGKVEDYANSECQSNELHMNDSSRSCNMYNVTAHRSKNYPIDDDDFGCRSISGGQRRSSRTGSVQKRMMKEDPLNFEHGLERRLSLEYQKRPQAYDFKDGMHLHKYPSASRDSIHSKDHMIRFVSPVRQWGQVRPPRDPHHAVSEMHAQAYSIGSKSRLSDARSETKSRRSYR